MRVRLKLVLEASFTHLALSEKYYVPQLVQKINSSFWVSFLSTTKGEDNLHLFLLPQKLLCLFHFPLEVIVSKVKSSFDCFNVYLQMCSCVLLMGCMLLVISCNDHYATRYQL